MHSLYVGSVDSSFRILLREGASWYTADLGIETSPAPIIPVIIVIPT